MENENKTDVVVKRGRPPKSSLKQAKEEEFEVRSGKKVKVIVKTTYGDGKNRIVKYKLKRIINAKDVKKK